MSKFCEKLNKNKFVITAELFPPKGTDVESLMKKSDLLGPIVDGINVTDNQRASMRLGSMAICRLIKEKGYEPILQMTCRDRNRIALQSDLLSAYVLGIENVLILSGDHNKIGEYKDAKPVYDLDTVQLLTVAKQLETGVDMVGKHLKGSPKFCLGAVVNPTASPVDLQVIMMGKKSQAGAAFFQTQPIYDIEQYKGFLKLVSQHKVKILPGVILIKSAQFIKFLLNMPGVNIPDKIVRRIEQASDPLKEGMKICSEIIKELRSFADGVHIMAIGMEEYIPEIIENSK
ncbi:MAG: methylenetetrahydrofolate reductase [Endomicrobiales bacterium]|nr:methylenetetrahydrofolate reductase [Endomicrobiales bacterium]